jgi:hypothetical protein
MIRVFILSGLLALCAMSANAADMRSMEINYVDGRYFVESVVWFDAGTDETFAVFSDYDLSTEFTKAVVEARDLEPDAQGRPGFYIRNRGCILFFCKSVVRQGYVESQGNRLLQAFTDPSRSDFRFCEESWEFATEDGGTSVRYKLEMEPGFWVPPAIGPYMIKRKLRSDGGGALDRIEAIAQDHGSSQVKNSD